MWQKQWKKQKVWFAVFHRASDRTLQHIRRDRDDSIQTWPTKDKIQKALKHHCHAGSLVFVSATVDTYKPRRARKTS